MTAAADQPFDALNSLPLSAAQWTRLDPDPAEIDPQRALSDDALLIVMRRAGKEDRATM